jgi:hypothetical protein
LEKVVRSGRQALVIITYHHSKGDERRGCAGFNFHTADARAHTFEIQREMSAVFGAAHGTVYPLVCGFETDEDALVVHGANGETLNMADLSEADVPGLPQRLLHLLPDMPTQIRHDLLPLLLGNLRHIAQIRQTVRTLDIEHREWMICVGRGFDWLHLPNLALIIGPYSPDLADPIRKAAGIIRANMRAGRIPDDGFLMLSSVPYEDIGVDRARAVLKSNFMADFAADVVRKEFEDLAPLMTVRKTVLNWNSRAVEPLDAGRLTFRVYHGSVQMALLRTRGVGSLKWLSLSGSPQHVHFCPPALHLRRDAVHPEAQGRQAQPGEGTARRPRSAVGQADRPRIPGQGRHRRSAPAALRVPDPL